MIFAGAVKLRAGARLALLAGFTCVPAIAGAQENPKVQAGLLECRGEAAVAYGLGSTRAVKCDFRPAAEMGQFKYIGTFERAGLDFGVSDQGSMLWMVLATTRDIGPEALAGEYVGLSTGFALGPGFSANVLVAKGGDKGIALQPLSVSADSGLSVSLAGASLKLQPYKSAR